MLFGPVYQMMFPVLPPSHRLFVQIERILKINGLSKKPRHLSLKITFIDRVFSPETYPL